MNDDDKQRAYGHGHGHADSPYCCFHPRELVVGVCAHCLKDRLLLLLAAGNPDVSLRRRTTSISLPKVVFALGSSFLQRLDSRHHRPGPDAAAAGGAGAGAGAGGGADDDDGGTTSAASLDDSFISIKFEDNGKATWDSRQNVVAGKAAPPVRSSSSSVVVVAEHVKRGGVTRWRKQVLGRLLQLARWKKAAAAAAAAGERSSSKARGGRVAWIRSLTTRRRAAANGERSSCS